MTGVSLITSLGSDFMKNFPAQNEINCDALDAFAGDTCLTTDAIGQYVPILGASTTDPTLGAGEIKGFYYKIWDQVYVWGEFKFGTGFAVGSGTYTITTPFPMNTTINNFPSLGFSPMIGSAYIWDESSVSTRFAATVHMRSTTTVQFGLNMASTSIVVNNSVPLTWAVDDGIRFSFRYQRIHS